MPRAGSEGSAQRLPPQANNTTLSDGKEVNLVAAGREQLRIKAKRGAPPGKTCSWRNDEAPRKTQPAGSETNRRQEFDPLPKASSAASRSVITPPDHQLVRRRRVSPIQQAPPRALATSPRKQAADTRRAAGKRAMTGKKRESARRSEQLKSSSGPNTTDEDAECISSDVRASIRLHRAPCWRYRVKGSRRPRRSRDMDIRKFDPAALAALAGSAADPSAVRHP